MQIQIIEWPQVGSATRFPMGGWYLVEHRERRGYTPIAGPFRTRLEAEETERARLVSAAAEAVETIDADALEAYATAQRDPLDSGLCCMARHANAVAPWTCNCPCHTRDAVEDELNQAAHVWDDRDEAYERAAARACGNDFADTGGKDWR